MPVCRRCGQENPDVARLCMVCGTPFAHAPARRREERKVVTVLFADLVGFTSRSEGMDVEDVRGTLVPYHSLLRRELERHGGTVEKFIGDAVMALFGAPTAHEDDPERAVRAALAIRDAVAELDAAEPGPDLHVRVGVNTGEALVAVDAKPAEGEGMAAGDVVNTAARLQAAAPVDGVLVGEATYRATAAAVEYRAVDAVSAKGKAAPVPVWEAVAPRARLGIDVRQAPATPFVGREPQLRMLEAALDQARRDRVPQLVTLVGVPGIGKSRLVWELFQAVDAGAELVVWRQGRSLPYGEGVTFWAVGEMVKAQAGILETDAEADAAAKLDASVRDLLGDERDAAWVLRHLRPLVGVGTDGGGGGAGEATAAWRRYFEALAERGSAVLVFEDLHWADDALLAFVDELVEWAADVPLLVVGTARPELLERRPEWGAGKSNSLLVTLAPLSDADTARVIGGVLAQAVLPAETQTTLLALAAGNPLYAEEYVRMLVDRGLLVRDGAGWRMAPDADLPLPDSVTAIIAARLDMLAGAEKELLQDAAVLGKVFWAGAVGERAPELLHSLERKQFIRRERRSSVAGETEYAFRHALMRDVAYGQIPRARRADLHRHAAAWIEGLAQDRPDDHAEMLVHHYTSALEYARASGSDVAELERRARTAIRAAADRAWSLSALEAARRYYAAAAEMWPRDDPACGRVLLRAGETARGSGHEAAYFAEALPLLRDAGDLEGAALVMSGQAWVAWNKGRAAEAEGLFAAALAMLEGGPASETRSVLLEQQARRRMLADRYEEAAALAADALRIAEELGLAEQRIECLIMVGSVNTAAGDPAGPAQLEQALALAREQAYGIGISRAYKNLASFVFEAGEVERALELWEEAAVEAERFGNRFDARWFEVERALAYMVRGELERPARLLDGFLAAVEGGQRHYMEGAARETLVSVHLARGEVDAALEQSAAAVAFAGSSEDLQTVMPALTAHSSALLAAGRAAEASAVATDVLGRMPTSNRGPWLVELAVVLRALGRGDELAAADPGAAERSAWGAAALHIARHDDEAARAVLLAAGAPGMAGRWLDPPAAASEDAV